MIKILRSVWILPVVFFVLGAAPVNKTKSIDVNKDGKPDVVYYHDGKNVTGAKADTNYDGRTDVIVYAKEGKFKKAEVDTDHDGKFDKSFDSTAQFKQWVNENRSDFNDSLDWDEYSRKIEKVFWKPGVNN